MSVRDDFIAFCETVGGQPLTPQQRLIAEMLSDQQKSKTFIQGQQKSITLIQGLHKRFMQSERTESQPRIRGYRAGLLIIDDCEPSTKESHEDLEIK